MKKLLYCTAAFLVLTFSANSQDKFTEAMKKQLAAFDTTSKPEAFSALGNSFQRIGDVEKTQWLPYYYAALSKLMSGLIINQTDPSQSDMYADQAEEFYNKAKALTAENSELHCLGKILATLRMLGDPQNRYMQYSGIAAEHLAKARKLDPTNPRPDYLEAQDLYYTPEQFGGDKKKAVEMLKTALVKFEAFIPASPIHPYWGKQQVQTMLTMANGAGK